MVTHHHNLPCIDRPTIAAPIEILSATGSKKVPKLVTCLRDLASFPSKKSVSPTRKNPIQAITRQNESSPPFLKSA